MSAKMLVAKLTLTGAVLAPVSRTAAGAPKAAELLGDAGLWVDADDSAHLEIGAEDLTLDEVDWNEDVFAEPLVFTVSNGGALAVAPALTVALSAAKITVTLPPGTAAKAPAWIQLEGGSQEKRITLPGAVPDPAPVTWDIPQPLDPGKYRYLVSVAGCQTRTGTKTI